MINQNPAEPQASSTPDAKAVAAEVPVLKPGDPIEVASTGDGTVTDPSAKDKPPGVSDSDLLFLA
jgi:hypothetical protein